VESNSPAPRFEPIDQQQVVLEPLDIEQLVAEGHPVRSIWAILGRLDLSLFVYTAKREDYQRCRKRPFCTPQNAMGKHGRAVSVRVEPEAIERYHRKMATEAGDGRTSG
jgi:hypothetical protein